MEAKELVVGTRTSELETGFLSNLIRVAIAAALVTVGGCGVTPTESIDQEEVPETASQMLSGTGIVQIHSDQVHDAASVTVGANTYHQFFHNFLGMHHWTFQNNQWSYEHLGAPSGVTFLHMAATHSGEGWLEVFAVSTAGKIYHNFASVGSAWSGWQLLAGGGGITIPAAHISSGIAVTSWGPRRIDLFWFTPTNRIAHAWWEQHTLQGAESGLTTSKTWFQVDGNLQPNDRQIEAVSTAFGKIDLFYTTPGDFGIRHHFFANNSWGTTAAPNRRRYACNGSLDGSFSPTTFALSISGGNNIDFTTVVPPWEGASGGKSLRSAGLNQPLPNNTILNCLGLSTNPPNTNPAALFDGLRWTLNGVPRTELLGVATTLYQATFF